MENALAALHASMALQRLSQAASALLCKRKGTVSARALANAHRNPAVSLDHRPPHLGCKDHQTPLALHHQRALGTLVSSTIADCSAVAVERRHQRGVNGQLSSPPQGEAVRNDLQSSTVQPVELSQIQIPDENVGRDPRSCLPAHLCCSALDGETPPTQNPSLRARCTMVAKYVELAATSRYEKKGATGDGDVCTVGGGTAAWQSSWPYWWGERSGQRTPEGHVATSTWPVQSLRGTATQHQDGTFPADVSKPAKLGTCRLRVCHS